MLKSLVASVLVILLGVAPVGADTEAYDLLFKQGTLDAISRDEALVYNRQVSNVLRPETEKRDNGLIALSFQPEDKSMASLQLRQGEKQRMLGKFPASVGNPMIMYFYESVVRDMAQSAGGSPYYIRNRVKDALVQPAEIEDGSAIIDGRTIKTRIVRLKPFAADPNKDRMRGFGSLEMVVTMSEDVPGWYLSLEALTSAEGQSESVYHSVMEFIELEARQ